MSLHETIKMPKDLYATLSDGTKPPLPQGRRTQLLAQLEGKTWTWRWAARPGFENPPRNYDNVMELLDKHRKDWLSNIIQKYGDLGQDDL
ncbi:hypothetical protein KCU83_g9045, partial [Aureobasidium melanogenum]